MTLVLKKLNKEPINNVTVYRVFRVSYISRALSCTFTRFVSQSLDF